MFKHYTVGYHEADRSHKDICTYAEDSYDALQTVKSDLPYLDDHPNSIDSVLLEKWTILLIWWLGL